MQYATGQCGSMAQDLINSSRLIPLYKDAQGSSLRPVAIPTLWRKVFGRATVEHYRPVLRHAAGPSQFAAMTPDGGAKLAATTMAAANGLTGERLLLRTDIQNAFNEIHRHVVYESLSYATPALAASQYAWLSRPTHAVLDNHASRNVVLSTTIGIPQGDPLSSLAFAVALARPIAALQQDYPNDSAVAYADDVLLLAEPDRAHVLLSTWQTLIAAMGLKINASKLVIWSPAGRPFPPRLREACPQAQYTTEGLVICGVPVQADGEIPADEAAPLGPPAFTETFLLQVRRKFARRLAALSALIEAQGPASIATHLAFQILRVNLQHSFTHLFRVCAWGTLLPWASQLQTDTLEWVQDTLRCPLPEGHARQILSLPLRHAGLGILDLQHEAALHFVQGALALSDHGRLSLANTDSWTMEVAAAIGHLEARSGINVEDLVAGKPTHKQGRLVRLAFYDALATRRNVDSAWLSPPPGEPVLKRLQTQAGLAWFTASPHTFLPYGPFRLAFATHLRLPVFERGQRCQYRPLSSGIPCHQQLGPYCCHVHTCAYGPRMRRHDRLRNAWAELAREAGWHVGLEQLVRTHDGATHRADIVATSPEGTQWALDISITASPDLFAAPHDHLQRSADAKATRYTPGGQRTLQDGHTLVPLIHSADSPWMCQEAAGFLQRLLRSYAARQAPVEPEDWLQHCHQQAAHWHASLSQCLALLNWQMHAACGRLL